MDFGNTGEVQFYLNNYTDYDSLKDAVKQIPYKDQNTNTADGIRKLRTLFRSYNGSVNRYPSYLGSDNQG